MYSAFQDGPKFKGFYDLMQNADAECPYAWNFGNLTKRPKTTGMTIEWRQPPGVTTAEQCLAWTELAVRFVQAARDWKDMAVPSTGVGLEMMYSRDVDGLKRFLQECGGYPGADEDRLNDIFSGKSGSEPVVDYDHRVDHSEEWDIEHPKELIRNEL
ncbi:hypothetical protein GE09DRAFT_1056396 [Coniochaeta sp. 2T2.1]|nr:hypothetical protein GE09DRAFT_1056396 [Coniochaeta sp. 2T2.1]